ncbi:hypothetical protein LNQ03_25630 [Klebsiella pneumoniae subsp. pneumoniae]|nr:hypothetical protein [Klebsiella pneumoniae subsp. pneumoniae]
MFSFLTKPVDKDALYKAIDEALEQRSPATDEALAPGDCNPQPADAAPA